jgi:hypothetical protein
VVESSLNSDPGLHKRRSTRVVQSIPLTVSGVDALGQAFKERTATTIIGCHGCRYQSKHYVPKNTPVTLEIPRGEAEQPPRVAKGHVVWVQRPRTVRELFQIGVELEVPGNVWGVTFPPDDWFPWPEDTVAEIPSPAMQNIPPPAAKAIPDESWPVAFAPAEQPTPAAPPSSTTPSAPASEEKIRVVPAPLTEQLSMTLARQVARLVAEAKQGLQQSVHEHANMAVAQAAKAARDQLDAKMKESAERALDSAVTKASAETLHNFEHQAELIASRAAESAAQKVLEQLAAQRAPAENAGATSLDTEALDRKVQERVARHLAEAEKRLTALLTKSARPEREILSQGSQAPAAPLGEAGAERRSAAEQVQSAAALARDEISAQAQKIAQSLRAGMESERRAAGEQAQTILTQASQRLTSETQSAIDRIHDELQAERKGVEESASALEKATAGASDSAAKLRAAAETALADARQRLDALLGEQGKVVERRTQELFDERARRLEPAFDAVAQRALANFAGQVQQQLAPEIGRAQATAAELGAAGQLAEQDIREMRERIAAASEEALRESLRQFQERAAQLPAEFERTCRASLEKAEQELDEKSTDATHTAFEALLKASDWYQKKTQTSMQASMEKALEQASSGMRERAGEVSRLFASELDHYSRSYVDHSKGLLEDAAKEAVEDSHKRMGEAAETTAASFSDELHRMALADLEQFRRSSSQAGDTAIHEFQRALIERIEEGVQGARDRLEAQLIPLLDGWRSEGDAQKQEWLEELSRVTNGAVEHYKSRLESASNTWLLASAATLAQHSQGVLESLAAAAEIRLRETCSQVFAGLGETLRQRLLGLSSDLSPRTNPPDQKK